MFAYCDQRSHQLTPMRNQPRWCEDAVRIFEGEFTVGSDRDALVDTVLQLWAAAVREQDDICKLVQLHKHEVFPSAHFGDLVDLLESSFPQQEKHAAVGEGEAAAYRRSGPKLDMHVEAARDDGVRVSVIGAPQHASPKEAPPLGSSSPQRRPSLLARVVSGVRAMSPTVNATPMELEGVLTQES